MTADTTIDVRDYADDPLTLAMVELERMAALWPPDVRDEVVETLGGLAIICATRGAPVHTAAAEFLSVARRLDSPCRRRPPIHSARNQGELKWLCAPSRSG